MAIRPVFTEIIWDSISQLDVSLENKSTWTGSFVQDESNAGNGGDGYANLTIDSSSTWIVDGDSTLSSLTCKGTITVRMATPLPSKALMEPLMWKVQAIIQLP